VVLSPDASSSGDGAVIAHVIGLPSEPARAMPPDHQKRHPIRTLDDRLPIDRVGA